MASFMRHKKLPTCLNTQQKWDEIVFLTDNYKKFDEIALEVLDDGDIDVFEFQEIMKDLTNDIYKLRPESARKITDLMHVVDEFIVFLKQKVDERVKSVHKKQMEQDEFVTCDCAEGVTFSDKISPPPSYSELKYFGWKPKYIQYLSLAERLATFNTWPKQMNPKPEELAQAGFFYEGVSDTCCCFYCGVIVHNWEIKDRAIEEHRKWQPSCDFIQSL